MLPDPQLNFLIPSYWGAYGLVKDFQSGLVGILGFFGVMATLWWNARLARQARSEVLEHDKSTLRVSLAAELAIVAERIHVNLKLLEGPRKEEPGTPEGARTVLPLPQTELYDAVVDRLGTLDVAQTKSVLTAYSTVKLTLANMNPETEGLNVGLYILRKDWTQSYINASHHTLDQIGTALRYLNAEDDRAPAP